MAGPPDFPIRELLRIFIDLVKVPEALPGNCEISRPLRKYWQTTVAIFAEKVFCCSVMNNGYSCVGDPEKSLRGLDMHYDFLL